MLSRVIPNDYTGQHFEWIDEWMQNACSGTGAVTAACGTAWASVNTGAAAQWVGVGTTTRPGIIQGATGSTNTGRAILATSITAVDFGAGNWTMENVLGFETLSTSGEEYSYFLGFADTISSINNANGCGFYYDRGNVATNGANSGNADKMQCSCANGGVRTFYLLAGSGNSDNSFPLGTVSVGALTLPSTNIMKLKVVMTGTTTAEFYSAGVKVCEINTHIPTGGSTKLMGAMMRMIKSAGTTSRTVDVDSSYLAVDLTAARTP